MRAITPQTLSWLRAAVSHELSTSLASSAVRSSSSSSSSSSNLPRPRLHASITATTFSPSAPRRSYGSSKQTQQDAPTAPRTHYDFFPNTLGSGPPPAGPFAVDLRALRAEFIRLQAAAHPDRHGGADKRKAEALSARINEAYKTLQNPLLRAQYLLSLRGIDVAEDEGLKVEDPELLMEVLEMRERIEEAGSEGEVEAMKRENGDKVEASVRVLDEAFRTDDVERAKSEAVRLRYWVNIQESLEQWEAGKPVVLSH